MTRMPLISSTQRKGQKTFKLSGTRLPNRLEHPQRKGDIRSHGMARPLWAGARRQRKQISTGTSIPPHAATMGKKAPVETGQSRPH